MFCFAVPKLSYCNMIYNVDKLPKGKGVAKSGFLVGNTTGLMFVIYIYAMV